MKTVTSRTFPASKYAEALGHKLDTGGIMRRVEHERMGIMYEVIYLPLPEWAEQFQKMELV